MKRLLLPLVLILWCFSVNGTPYCDKACRSSLSVTRSEQLFFRSDYNFEPSQNAHYKLHRNKKHWADARTTCSYEGASLAVPENTAEIEILVRMMNDNLDNTTTAANIGIHDIYAEGIYVTVDGGEMVFKEEDWAPGEPNNGNNQEDCIHIRRTGKFNDANCNWAYPFFCKKKNSEIIYEYNVECETSDIDYFRTEKADKCYKLHLEPNTWSKAYEICNAEQSYLAIINSEQEAKLFKDELDQHPADSLPGTFFKDGVYVGFTDLFREGEYLTIHGQPLSKSGYVSWSILQPDNAENNENCGHMLRSGLLNDINCAKQLMFFCERDVGRDVNLLPTYELRTSFNPAMER